MYPVNAVIPVSNFSAEALFLNLLTSHNGNNHQRPWSGSPCSVVVDRISTQSNQQVLPLCSRILERAKYQVFDYLLQCSYRKPEGAL